MERINFMMGNVCERLEKVGKHGNVAGTCTQDVRKVGTEPKSNNGSGAERPRWADYEDFEEDVDDIGDGGFKDETIGGTCTQELRKVGAELKSNNGSGPERPRWADHEDFEEDDDDIGDGGFKDETIGCWEGFRQPRNQRDFMYYDEVLLQKKMSIQKERWYQRERNKEISVLKKESNSLSRILGEIKQELDVLTTTVNA